MYLSPNVIKIFATISFQTLSYAYIQIYLIAIFIKVGWYAILYSAFYLEIIQWYSKT